MIAEECGITATSGKELLTLYPFARYVQSHDSAGFVPSEAVFSASASTHSYFITCCRVGERYSRVVYHRPDDTVLKARWEELEDKIKDKDEDKKAAARKDFVDRCVRDVKERHKVTSCDLSIAVLHSLLLWTR